MGTLQRPAGRCARPLVRAIPHDPPHSLVVGGILGACGPVHFSRGGLVQANGGHGEVALFDQVSM